LLLNTPDILSIFGHFKFAKLDFWAYVITPDPEKYRIPFPELRTLGWVIEIRFYTGILASITRRKSHGSCYEQKTKDNPDFECVDSHIDSSSQITVTCES
jgi:hypothetical protein